MRQNFYTMRSQFLISLVECQSVVVPWLQSSASLFNASSPSAHPCSHVVIVSSASYLSAFFFFLVNILCLGLPYILCVKHVNPVIERTYQNAFLISLFCCMFLFHKQILTWLKIIAKHSLDFTETGFTVCVWICLRDWKIFETETVG